MTLPKSQRPVNLHKRAELWVMPSRSEKDKVRFVVVFKIGKQTFMNCSCPAGTKSPPSKCYHTRAVHLERIRLKQKAKARTIDSPKKVK